MTKVGWLVGGWVGACLMALSAQISYIIPGPGGKHCNINRQNEEKYTRKHSLQPSLCGDNLLITDRHPQRSFFPVTWQVLTTK